ncbi:MAG: hypothetical protein J6N47_03570 [Lachnospiraceae bacterium]|nr:hypothetical protein [Lachnospiraceae bacterium]
MKVFKRYWRGIVFAAVFFVMLFFRTGNTAAADLEQSPDVVSMEIVHEHDDETCTKEVWIPCGGSWRDDHHGSHRIHYCTNQKSEEIVNGHSLSEIHYGDWYWGYSTEEHHAGEYVTEPDCDLSTIGFFEIKRTEDEDGIHLTAGTRVTDADLGDYTISWDDGTAGGVNSSVMIDVDTRRTYTATIRWHDVKRNADFTDSLSYTDISYPCRCEFVSDDAVVEEIKIRCGESPDAVDVPVKKGHIFDGYYKDDVQWIDQEGNPTENFIISQSDYDLSLAAKWLAKTYELKIGNEILTFVYGEPYGDIDAAALGLQKEGYEFSGVRIEGEVIFDEDGKAAGDGVWKWDVSEEVTAEILWDEIPEETDEYENDDDHHRHHEHVEDKEKEDAYEEPAETVILAVSDDRCEAADPYVDVVADESLLEDNDDEDCPVVADASSENSSGDGPEENVENVPIESVGVNLPFIELFQAENNDEPLTEEYSAADEEDKRPDSGESFKEKASPSVWIKRVMVVTAVACGVVGGGTAAVYAVYAGFVYLFGMASVMNVLPDGRKKNLGKLTVSDRSGGDMEINIPQNFVDNCSTGNIEIVMPEMFVKKRDRKQLVVIVNEKKYLKNIKKNVELKLFS